MMAVSGLIAIFPGRVGSSCPRLLLGNKTWGLMRKQNNPVKCSSFLHPTGKTRYLKIRNLGQKCAAMSAGRSGHDPSFNPDLSPEEPLWLTLIKELIWSLRSMFSFLREQPNQLKYIEWPSFESTLKTASLTLVLVALLIVALTSVDTVLSYVSRLLLRKAL